MSCHELVVPTITAALQLKLQWIQLTVPDRHLNLLAPLHRPVEEVENLYSRLGQLNIAAQISLALLSAILRLFPHAFLTCCD